MSAIGKLQALEAERRRRGQTVDAFFRPTNQRARLQSIAKSAGVELPSTLAGEPLLNALQELYLAVADGISGLPAAYVVAKAETMPADALLAGFRALVQLEAEFAAENLSAHTAHRARITAAVQEQINILGVSTFEEQAAAESPELLAFAQRWAKQADRFALYPSPAGEPSAANVAVEISYRVKILGRELAKRYATDGLPAELVKIDAGLAKLRNKALDAERALDDAKKDYRLAHGGADREAACAKAAAAVDVLHREAAELARAAWSAFGVRRAA